MSQNAIFVACAVFFGLDAGIAADSGQLSVAPIPAVSLSEEVTTAVRFHVDDPGTVLSGLTVTGTSSDQQVIPDGGIVFSGIGQQREAILSPKQPGRAQISVKVSDGRTSAVRSFDVTVTPRASELPGMALSAVVSEKPTPSIRLIFPTAAKATQYEVYRKDLNAGSWGNAIASLPGTATDFTESQVSLGAAYEYRVVRDKSYPAFLYAGVRASPVENRGTAILIVDRTFASELASGLTRWQQDAIGDGWKVIRHDVSRDDDPRRIKELIKADYAADPSHVKSLFLFGHVPVVYSGWYAPDGHHQRAFPADVFYADLDGVWTDEQGGGIEPERHLSRNYPGDGRYDQSSIPSDVELETGRVDLYNMPSFLPNTEKDLLRQYLEKDHNFRRGLLTTEHGGLADGWIDASLPNQAAFFGASKIARQPFLSTLSSGSYLWASRAQYGNYRGFNDGGASTADFSSADPKAIFFEVAGSYFGEWDTYDDFLRAPLCAASYGLAASYSMPPWRYQHMALGQAVGYSAKITQNNRVKDGLYSLGDANEGRVHIALMGDPTLRLHPCAPVRECYPTIQGRGVLLRWKEPAEPIEGYLVYRSSSPDGPFTRRTASILKDLSFLDERVSPGSYTYMVRVVKLEVSGSGTYENLSEGILRTVTVGAAPDKVPPSITLASPARGSTVYNPVELRAVPRDDRGVALVEFSVDGQPVGAAVEDPYSVRWDTTHVSGGQHTIIAKVLDTSGNSSLDSATVTLAKSDTALPKVSIAEPSVGQRVWGNVIIRVAATDNAGVDRVEMRVDGQLLGTARRAPWQFIWKTFDPATAKATVADGLHRFSATAYDLSGNHSENSVTATVDSSLSHPTILPGSPRHLIAEPGQLIDFTYNWQGGPAMRELGVFTHFVDAKGEEKDDSHLPAIPSQFWSGDYSYPVKLRINRSLHPGDYKIMSGLALGADRPPLNAGPGVAKDYQNRFEIGELTVLPDKTPPTVSTVLKPDQKVMGKISVSVRAVDNVDVEHAELIVDGGKPQLIKTSANLTDAQREQNDNLQFSGNYLWDTTELTNGLHRVRLRAIDSAGNPGEVSFDVHVGNLTLFRADKPEVAARAGEKVEISYHWSGGPMPYILQVSTELVSESTRRTAFRATNAPSPSPELWTGDDTTVSQSLALPPNLAPDNYKIAIRVTGRGAGLMGSPVPIAIGPGVATIGTGPTVRYVIGRLKVIN